MGAYTTVAKMALCVLNHTYKKSNLTHASFLSK